MATATTAAAADAAAQTSYAPPLDAAAGPLYVDTQHEDLVHDAQMDFYGSKLATCSSDRTIKIYNVSETAYEIAATLTGHEGPVWQVSWAHPTFGVMLASCSFDGSVLVHRQDDRSHQWSVVYAARGLHESSVNGVALCPHEYGLQVAASSSDGRVSVLSHQQNQTWSLEYLQDCPTGVNAVSWAPYGAYYDADAAAAAAASEGDVTAAAAASEVPRLVTAGCDNQIRFYVYNADQGQWARDTSPIAASSTTTHTDWVRDVAWAPCLLPNVNRVASCSEDKTVLIWTQKGGSDAEWTPTLVHTFEDPVWRVSWSVTGHLLAVSSGDSTVTLWKQSLDETWTQVETATEEEEAAAAPLQQ